MPVWIPGWQAQDTLRRPLNIHKLALRWQNSRSIDDFAETILGLLDDLKKQADAVRTQDNFQRTVQTENIQVVEAAMRRSFKYLHDLLEQLKVLKPVNPIVYALPGIGEMRDLAFTDSSIDYRTAKVADKDHYERVDLYVMWTSPTDLVVERDMPQTAEKVRDSLRSANVKFSEEEKKGPLGTVQLTRFKIPKTVRMDVSLRADYLQRRLLIIAKNLLRTGGDDFAIPADDCSEKILEDLARLLIGQPSDLRRYRTVLTGQAGLSRS